MKITFNNDEYINTHGKNPTGFGHWCFAVDEHVFWCAGNLSDAKKSFRRYLTDILPSNTGSIVAKIMP